MNTEVDTIDEANNIFAIPQAKVSAGAGGEVHLQAGRNINLGNVDSSSTIEIDAESTALDNFSIITALLELNTADGGNINLVAGNDLTTNNLSSNVSECYKWMEQPLVASRGSVRPDAATRGRKRRLVAS